MELGFTVRRIEVSDQRTQKLELSEDSVRQPNTTLGCPRDAIGSFSE
jgi:hypothetical protein